MKGADYIPTLTHATERDIDLLLVEELYANYDFLVWLAAKVDIDGPFHDWDVKHSKRRTQSRREIDIFVEMKDQSDCKHALLIENKIDAGEQPDQAESYREELAVLAEPYARRAMIIVCPEAYALQHHEFTGKFDAVVTYQDVRGFFDQMAAEVGDDLVLRARLRRELFDQAIEKHRRGYTPVPDKVVGDFNALYVALLRRLKVPLVPGKSMLKVANPRESTSMIFDQDQSLSRLPKAIRPRRFAHELGRGSDRRANYVAVTFAGWGVLPKSTLDELARDVASLGAILQAKPATKARPNPGLVLAVSTAPVDNQGSFAEQEADLVQGIEAAVKLRSWLFENTATLLRLQSEHEAFVRGKT